VAETAGVADLTGKLVVRKERKGRGGRTVTVLSGITGEPAALDAFARRLRKSLGCGANVEGSTIVLQGDLRGRARDQLAAWGARRVILGN
jgi:translation initiation factor 1